MLNLTPHAVVLESDDGDITIPPSGTVARVSTTRLSAGKVWVDGSYVPVVTVIYGDVEGLPPEGTPCIVSAIVAARVPGRAGVYSPDTSPEAARRDGKGRITAVAALVAA